MKIYSSPRNIAILGSTGSIGRQTLDVLEGLSVSPVSLAADRNTVLMEEQIRRYHPRYAVMRSEEAARSLRISAADCDTKILSGSDGIISAVTLPEIDTVVTASTGISGLIPTIAAINAGKDIALANKETLVCAGDIIIPLAKRRGVRILPVDSEHSAIWQSLRSGRRSELSGLILTASGGPFWGKSFDELETVRPTDALAHPNWKMGPKITIDCSTLMNKGLELIEAMHLYSISYDKIEIVIHRQSVFHSFAVFCDGSVIGQAANPDMRLPIQYALTYPRRYPSPAEPLSLTRISELSFYPPDENAFPCLSLAKKAASSGGSLAVIMNGANETAVAMFLEGSIGFNDIYRSVAYAMDNVTLYRCSSIDDIMALDTEARASVGNYFLKGKI